MEPVYARAKDLREKVESVMLKKIEWRILFSVDGKRSVPDIAAKVERDENFVGEVLEKLAGDKLITGGGAPSGRVTTKEPDADAKKADSKKEKKETKKKEPVIEAEPVKEVKKEAPKPKEEPKAVATPKKEDFDLMSAMTDSPKEEPKKVETKAAATAKPVATATGAGGKKILVVDDSIVIQKMVEIALENEHYALTSAMKGEDAIRLAKELQPNLILLDMMLPDMSGLEVMKAVRELGGSFATVPIVVLSGKDSPQDKDTAINNGANDFLTKPFHDEDLLSKVHEYIAK
ncbi:response regulator [bacterium]|nr:response regulator [bacterium]